jgi:large repetitive protein
VAVPGDEGGRCGSRCRVTIDGSKLRGVTFGLMSMPGRWLIAPLAVLLAGALSAISAQGPRPSQPQQSSRDTPAQRDATLEVPKGKISGRVVAADTGRPVRRARVSLTAPELPEGRGTLTDDSGVFEITELPPGRYTLAVSKTGFVTLSYGQRRPLQAGTPLQLAEGQEMSGIDFRLPRGSVIAGHVFDETGEPMPGATIRVLRYQYTQGERQLAPAGTAQSDDQGAYRVWGLNPGDYYVSAVARNFNVGPGPGGRGGFGPGRGGPGGRGAFFEVPEDETQRAYAPTYYPGVGSINEARTVSVSVSQQSVDVNFNMLLVRTARITGMVTNPDGSPSTNGVVNLTPEGLGGRGRGPTGADFGGRISWDGKFTIANVPPGTYTLRARGNDTEVPQYAAQPLTVTNGDVNDVSVVLYPGATISGTVTVDGANLPDLTQVRITAPSAENATIGPNPNARVDKDGRFTLEGVPAGAHWIRSAGLRGWSLKSVIVDSHDVVDQPVEIRSDQKLTNVAIVLTSRQTEINGTITNEQSMPITDYTVLAFPTDSDLWRPLARQIATGRPDQNGRFQIRGLPPGNYYLATVDPAEQGEWFEPAYLEQQRNGAARVSLGEGDVKTHDFHVSTR